MVYTIPPVHVVLHLPTSSHFQYALLVIGSHARSFVGSPILDLTLSRAIECAFAASASENDNRKTVQSRIGACSAFARFVCGIDDILNQTDVIVIVSIEVEVFERGGNCVCSYREQKIIPN